MSKRKVAKGTTRATAPTLVAATPTTNQAPIAAIPIPRASADTYSTLYDPKPGHLEYHDPSRLRKSHCCVIILDVEFARFLPCEGCGKDYRTNILWKGQLFDRLALADGETRTGPIAVVNASDDAIGSRDGVVLQLRDMASEKGYAFCEVRERNNQHDLKYTPLFGGPISELCATY